MPLPTENHPCFNDESRHTFGRIHLPVAPKCNIQCNYCNKKYDCINENRPGVTSRVLSPVQAVRYLDQAMAIVPNIAVVGIAGPGDPFANPVETMETLRLVREKYPELLLCVATNGLDLLPCIDELAALKVSHVTITINAVDPETGSEIYTWVRHKKKLYRDIDAAEILIKRQLLALAKLKEAGITAKVNSIIIPGINDAHIIEVARTVAALGADILNCMPYYRTTETVFENIREPSRDVILEIQAATAVYLPQMKHCARCRADAVGIIGEINSDNLMLKLSAPSMMPNDPKEPGGQRPCIAVSSQDGKRIDQHLGEADRFLVYTLDEENDRCVLLESRVTPFPGGGRKRWEILSGILNDCRALLVSAAGDSPISVLRENGIEVMIMEGAIEEVVHGLFTGKDMTASLKPKPLHYSGSGCGGGGCA